ncbi:MAG: hypothetical protein DRP57_12560 [Spirochaetes bacterium]|nr:MAG: hypothetical protein DRP57_12560 [Spirochaetota bacterium]
MSDLLRKGIFLGLGAASLTKEKVENLVNELVDKGDISKDKGSELLQELLNLVKEQEGKIDKKINEEMNSLIKKLDLASKSDIKRLEKKIDALMKNINSGK